MENKADKKCRTHQNIKVSCLKQGSEMKEFCLKQGQGLKVSADTPTQTSLKCPPPPPPRGFKVAGVHQLSNSSNLPQVSA